MAKLKEAGLGNLIYYHTPCDALFQTLHNATMNARAAGLPQTFTYVDITSPEVIPPWLSPEDIGGRSDEMEGFSELSGSVDTIAKLGRTLTAGF